MLKVAFALATLLAVEGAILAHPIINARGYGSPEIAPRAVPGKIQPRALDVITLDFAPWSLTHYLYNEIVNSLEPTPSSQQPHVARDLSDQEDIKIRDYREDEDFFARRRLGDGLMERQLEGGELDARDSDVVLVPRGGNDPNPKSGRRRGGRRRNRGGGKPPHPQVKVAEVQHPPPQHEAGKKEETAATAEHQNTAIHPEAPNADEPGGTAGSNPSLVHKVWNHELTQAGVGAAIEVLKTHAANSRASREATSPSPPQDEGGYY